MNLTSTMARLDRISERIPPLEQRFPDVLPHELALAFVDVSQWTEAPPATWDGTDAMLARHLLACWEVFDDDAYQDLLDDLRDAPDVTSARWRLELHVMQHPPSSNAPGEASWVSFRQHISDGFYDLMPGQHVEQTDDERQALLMRLLEDLRADLKAGKRYVPDWCRFVQLLEQGAFA